MLTGYFSVLMKENNKIVKIVYNPILQFRWHIETRDIDEPEDRVMCALSRLCHCQLGTGRGKI